MNRDSVTWSGYWPASPTPFHENGEIDFKRFSNLIKWYMDNGMHGIFLNGTTGEWFSQSISERMQVLEFVLAEVKNRVPVVVGVTTFTAKESIDLGKHAMKAGAAGVCASEGVVAGASAAGASAAGAAVAGASAAGASAAGSSPPLVTLR
mgnify:CR=1 FL=1